jgi:hypothetical protein
MVYFRWLSLIVTVEHSIGDRHIIAIVTCLQSSYFVHQVMDKSVSKALLAGVEQIVGSVTMAELCKLNALRHIGLSEHGKYVICLVTEMFLHSMQCV